jgi:nucleoid DNA-binding protein
MIKKSTIDMTTQKKASRKDDDKGNNKNTKIVYKVDISKMLAEKADISIASATTLLNNVVEIMSTVISQGKDISIFGFGIFKIKDRKAREAINPLNGDKIHIPASKAVTFKSSSVLKKNLQTLVHNKSTSKK